MLGLKEEISKTQVINNSTASFPGIFHEFNPQYSNEILKLHQETNERLKIMSQQIMDLNTEISFLKSKKSKKSKKSSFKSYISNNSDISNIEILVKLKKRLQKFLNNEETEFRSSKQVEAL